MAPEEKRIITVSSRGQVILPRAICKRYGWSAGARLVVEETADGVLLRPAPVFAQTRLEEVFGALPYKGTPKTISDMDAGVLAEGKRRALREGTRASTSQKVRPGPDAARSQDFLYGDDGMPR